MTIANKQFTPQEGPAPVRVELSRLAAQMVLQRDGLPAGEAPQRGFVEALDEVVGLRGWVAGASALLPPALELLIDGEVVAVTRPSTHRPDIWSNGHASHLSGFAFQPDELLAIAARNDISPAATIEVRLQGESLCLAGASEWRFSDLTAWLADESRDGAEHQTGIGLALGGELKRLCLMARRGFAQPISQEARKQVGMIEFVTPLGRHAFMVGGWMRRGQPTTFAAILVWEGERHAGALACATRARPDLGADAVAYVGVLSLERALPLSRPPQQWAIHFAGRSGHWLGAVQAIRIAEPLVALDELERAVGHPPTGRGAELQQFVRDHLPWVAMAIDDRNGIKVGLDDCFVLPGFGVFVSGWTLAPMGRLHDLTCKLGDAVFQLDPQSLALGARPDLGEPFPGYADRLDNAAFAAVLRGAGSPDPRARWMLRLRFDAGAEHLHEIALDRARLIDGGFDLQRLRAVYPGFETSPWLYEFADSLRPRPASPLLVWVRRTQCPQLIALALPASRAHQTVALDQCELALRALSPGIGIVLLAPSTLPPGLLSSWMQTLLSARPGADLGACRLEADTSPLGVLSEVLTACGAEGFVFVGPQVVLRTEGARAASVFLAEATRPPLTLFGVEMLAGGLPTVIHEASFFGWTCDGFQRFSHAAPPLVGGIWRDMGMQAHGDVRRVAPAPGRPHALRLRSAEGEPWLDDINARLLREHACLQAETLRAGE